MGKADEAFGGQHRVPDAAAGADAGSRFERGHARKGEGVYGRTRTVQLGCLGCPFSSTARCLRRRLGLSGLGPALPSSV